MDLADALDLGERELVAFVGAGGKKTAMAHLVDVASERGLQAGYTTTAHMPPPAALLLVVGEGEQLEAKLATVPPTAAFAAAEVDRPERAARKVRGHDPATISSIFDSGRFDWLLVKADGARRREFKAPGPDEPALPAASTHVVPVVSVHAVGRPLDEDTVHRPERVASITGLDHGDEITARAVGEVLASDAGGCKRVPAGATVTPLVNKADGAPQREICRDVLQSALDLTDRFDRGLVCSFENDFVEIVER